MDLMGARFLTARHISEVVKPIESTGERGILGSSVNGDIE